MTQLASPQSILKPVSPLSTVRTVQTPIQVRSGRVFRSKCAFRTLSALLYPGNQWSPTSYRSRAQAVKLGLVIELVLPYAAGHGQTSPRIPASSRFFSPATTSSASSRGFGRGSDVTGVTAVRHRDAQPVDHWVPTTQRVAASYWQVVFQTVRPDSALGATFDGNLLSSADGALEGARRQGCRAGVRAVAQRVEQGARTPRTCGCPPVPQGRRTGQSVAS